MAACNGFGSAEEAICSGRFEEWKAHFPFCGDRCQYKAILANEGCEEIRQMWVAEVHATSPSRRVVRTYLADEAAFDRIRFSAPPREMPTCGVLVDALYRGKVLLAGNLAGIAGLFAGYNPSAEDGWECNRTITSLVLATLVGDVDLGCVESECFPDTREKMFSESVVFSRWMINVQVPNLSWRLFVPMDDEIYAPSDNGDYVDLAPTAISELEALVHLRREPPIDDACAKDLVAPEWRGKRAAAEIDTMITRNSSLMSLMAESPVSSGIYGRPMVLMRRGDKNRKYEEQLRDVISSRPPGYALIVGETPGVVQWFLVHNGWHVLGLDSTYTGDALPSRLIPCVKRYLAYDERFDPVRTTSGDAATTNATSMPWFSTVLSQRCISAFNNFCDHWRPDLVFLDVGRMWASAREDTDINVALFGALRSRDGFVPSVAILKTRVRPRFLPHGIYGVLFSASINPNGSEVFLRWAREEGLYRNDVLVRVSPVIAAAECESMGDLFIESETHRSALVRDQDLQVLGGVVKTAIPDSDVGDEHWLALVRVKPFVAAARNRIDSLRFASTPDEWLFVAQRVGGFSSSFGAWHARDRYFERGILPGGMYVEVSRYAVAGGALERIITALDHLYPLCEEEELGRAPTALERYYLGRADHYPLLCGNSGIRDVALSYGLTAESPVTKVKYLFMPRLLPALADAELTMGIYYWFRAIVSVGRPLYVWEAMRSLLYISSLFYRREQLLTVAYRIASTLDNMPLTGGNFSALRGYIAAQITILSASGLCEQADYAAYLTQLRNLQSRVGVPEPDWEDDWEDA